LLRLPSEGVSPSYFTRLVRLSYQYQQSPAPLGGGLVKEGWFRRYNEQNRPERFDRIVQSWDTANKATELSDFSVCTTWGMKGKELFLLNLFRRRLEYPALKRAVREQQNLFNATEVLIEDKASGTQLIQELITEGGRGVTRYQPTSDKTMRLHAQTGMIENGFVSIPQTAPWLAEYLHEMTVFPNGKHDDQVDSTAQFLDWFKTPMPHWGIFEHTRRMAEKLKPPLPIYVRLKAPPGIGAVQTLSNRHITIGEDRIVEMSEEDANCLIPYGWIKLAERSRDEV
jgi:predicted phage terminase large subunit-like protein